MGKARGIVAAITGSTGQAEYAFAKLLSTSKLLGPALEIAFPVFAAIALVEIIESGIAAFEKFIHLGDEAIHSTNELSLSIAKQSDELELTNLRLDNTIAKLHGEPENLIAVALQESKMRADEFAKSLDDDVKKMQDIIDKAPGFWSSLVLPDTANVASLGKQFISINTAIEEAQTALQSATTEEEKASAQAAIHNALLDKREVLEKRIAEEKAQKSEIVQGPEGPQVIGREPDPKALTLYQGWLNQIDELLKNQHTSRMEEGKQLDLAQEEQSKQALDRTAKQTETEISAAKQVADARAKYAEQIVEHGTYTVSPDSISSQQEELENTKTEETRKALQERLGLEQQYVRQGLEDHLAQERALEAELRALEINHQAAIQKIREEGVARDLADSDAQIANEEKIGEARLKMQEAQEKVLFSRAGTPAGAEAAAIPLIKTTTDLYDLQIEKLKERAAAVEKTLPSGVPTPTAPIGTPEFTGQVAATKVAAPEATDQLNKLDTINAEIIVKENEKNGALTELDKERVTKVNELNQQQLKFSEELAKQDEDIALKKISAQEAAITGAANLAKTKLGATPISPAEKAEAGGAIGENEVAKLKEIEDEKYDIIVDSEKRQALAMLSHPEEAGSEAAEKQLEAIKKLYRDMEIAAIDHNAKTAELNRQMVNNAQKTTEEMTQAYMKVFSPVNSAFNTFMGHILEGNTTIAVAFQRMGQQIVRSTIESLAQALLHHIENAIAVQVVHATSVATQTTQTVIGQTAQTVAVQNGAVARGVIEAGETAGHAVGQTAQVGATVAGQAAQTAAAGSGAASRSSIGLIADLKSIGTAAATAAAHAFKWVMEEVPFPINAALAPAAAAAAFAGVMAFRIAASAQEGAVVPQDMPIYAHAGEMVLPTHLSEGVQNLVESGNAGKSGGGDTHIHMNWNALDGKSLNDFLHQPGVRAQFTKTLRSSVRNGVRIR